MKNKHFFNLKLTQCKSIFYCVYLLCVYHAGDDRDMQSNQIIKL